GDVYRGRQIVRARERALRGERDHTVVSRSIRETRRREVVRAVVPILLVLREVRDLPGRVEQDDDALTHQIRNRERSRPLERLPLERAPYEGRQAVLEGLDVH